MGITLGGIVGALLAGWFGGRAHLRANQLRALDAALKQPAGSLEARVNAATEQGASALARKVGTEVDSRLGGGNGDGK